MAEKDIFSNQAKNMRRQAEEKIALMTENPDALSPEETRQMLHELLSESDDAWFKICDEDLLLDSAFYGGTR